MAATYHPHFCNTCAQRVIIKGAVDIVLCPVCALRMGEIAAYDMSFYKWCSQTKETMDIVQFAASVAKPAEILVFLFQFTRRPTPLLAQSRLHSRPHSLLCPTPPS